MSDPWDSAKIRTCELATAAPGVSLLRIEAKAARRRADSGTPPPVLLADDGETVRRFSPVPSPSEERGTLQVAYSLPVEAITPRTVFSLRLVDGSVLSLPQPTTGAARASDAPGPAPAAASTTAAPPAPRDARPVRERRSDPLPKLSGLSAALAEAEHRAEDARQQAAAAEDLRSTLERERDEAVVAAETLRQDNARLQGTLDELEIWRAELERRLADTTTELGAAATRLRDNDAELTRLRAALTEARAGHAGQPETTDAAAATDAADLSALVQAADRVAEAAAELAQARWRVTEARPSPPAGAARATGALPPSNPPTGEGGDTGDLLRRAAARASERAARELSDALSEGS